MRRQDISARCDCLVYRYREAGAQDRAAILALRERCFADADPCKCEARFWDWEFGNARLFVGESDGNLVTHAAFVPWGEFALAVDAMTDTAARGKGAYSAVMRHALESVRGDFEVAHAYQIRDSVLGPMLRSGWLIAESIPVLVRPASLRALLGMRVREAEDEGAPVLTRDDASEMATLARTHQWIEWRFFDNPSWHYRVTAARDEQGRLVAWLVTRRTMLKGFDTLAIVDIAFRDAGAARRLIREAMAHAQRTGCQLSAAFVSRAHPARPLLLRSFFLPGPHRFRLLVHSFGKPLPRKAWVVTWADTDHL